MPPGVEVGFSFAWDHLAVIYVITRPVCWLCARFGAIFSLCKLSDIEGRAAQPMRTCGTSVLRYL